MSIGIESLNTNKSNKTIKNTLEGESFIKQKVNEPIHYFKLPMVFH